MTETIQQGRPEYEQIVRARSGLAAVGILDQVPLHVTRFIWQRPVKELFRVTMRIGHPVVQTLVVVALYELHTLALEPQVVAVRGQVSPGAVADASVLEHRHAVKTVDSVPDSVTRIPVQERRRLPQKQQQREAHR